MTAPFTKCCLLPPVCVSALICLAPISPSQFTLPLAPVNTACLPLFLARPPHQPVACTNFAGIRHHAPFGKDRLLLILTLLNPTDPIQGGGPTQKAPAYKNEARVQPDTWANEHQRPSLEACSSRLLFCESAQEEAIMHGSLSEFEKLADHAACSLDSNYPQIDKTAQVP
ncbi:hypothetical protein B0H14DRAFT_2607478 [Mycena olivaceomarginata]|nr:hypothetical protein B0H14DRAFT_2607478 [Mycena olivaceomarginata]